MTSFYDQALAFLYAAILAAVPLLYGTLGEILTEKSGSINLGVEGMMYLGAIAGFAVGYASSSPALTLLSGFAAGALGALIYAFLTVTLKANQNVTGLTLTVLGTGVANFIGEQIKTFSPVGTTFMSERLKAGLTPLSLGALSDLPVIGRLLFSHSILTYLALACAILMSLYLNRSRRGLNLRAIGENPAAADAMGVPVSRYKYLHILLGGGLSGLGGVYISMVTCLQLAAQYRGRPGLDRGGAGDFRHLAAAARGHGQPGVWRPERAAPLYLQGCGRYPRRHLLHAALRGHLPSAGHLQHPHEAGKLPACRLRRQLFQGGALSCARS